MSGTRDVAAFAGRVNRFYSVAGGVVRRYLGITFTCCRDRRGLALRGRGEKAMIVAVDSRFPLMSPDSAVFPTIRAVGADVFLAYHLPGCDDSAVVAFRLA